MLGTKSAVVFAGNWLAVVAQLISGILVARWLGPDAVGRIAYFFGLLGIFTMLTSFGFAQAHVKRVAEGRPLAECISAFWAVTVVLNGIMLLAMGVTWKFWGSTLHGPGEKVAFLLFVAYQFATNLAVVPAQTLVAKQEMARVAVMTASGRLVRIALALVVLWEFRSISTVGFIFLADGLTQLLIGLWWTRGTRISAARLKATLASYWAYAKPLALLTPLSVLIDSLDRMVLGQFWPASQLGFYSVARSVFEAVKSLPSAVVTAVWPRMTEEFVCAPPHVLRNTVDRVHRKLLLVVTPLVAVGIVLAEPIVNIVYGSSFAPAAQAIRVFLTVCWVMVVCTLFHYLMFATERHRSFLWINPLAAIVYAAALYGVAHSGLSISWAAACQFFFWIIPAFPIFLITKDLTGASFLIRTLQFALAGGATVAVHAYLTQSLVQPLGTAITALPAIIVYAALVKAQGLASMSDLRSFWSAANPGALWRYLLHETRGRRPIGSGSEQC